MIDWKKIPFSWGELNDKLVSCHTPEQLSQIFPLRSIDLAAFIEMIRYPIESYDLNFSAWVAFQQHVKRLYPSAALSEPFNQLQEKVKRQFSRLLAAQNPDCRTLAQSSTPAKRVIQMTVQDDSGLIKKEGMTVSEYLQFMLPQVTVEGDERFKQLLALQPPSSNKEKAATLQFILSYLLAEIQFMKTILAHVEGMERLHEMEGRYREGAQIVRLNRLQETRLYDITEDFEGSEECDFWMSLSPYIDFRQVNGRACLYFPLLFKQEHARITILNHLRQVQESATHHKVRDIADKLWIGLEFQQMIDKEMEPIREMYKMIRKWMCSFSTSWSETLEMHTSPFLYLIGNRLNAYLQSGINPDECRIQIEAISEFREIITTWKEHKNFQEDLYKAAYNELIAIIRVQKSIAQRKVFLSYTKTLLGDSNSDVFPKDFHELQPMPFKATSSSEACSSSSTPSPTKPKLRRRSIKERQKLKSQTTSKKKISVRAEPLPPIVTETTSCCSSSSEPIQMVKETTASSSSSSEPLPPSLILESLPGQSFPYIFSKRVARWDDHPFGEPLPAELFPEYQECDLPNQILQQLFHAPHPLINRFLHLAIEGIWKNRTREQEDLRKVIPAEISFNGRYYRGFIAYGIDANTKICYHRCFSHRIGRDFLYQAVQKIFDENDFPELNLAVKRKPSKERKVVQLDSTTIQVHPLFGSVMIEDHLRKVTIKLFKSGL